MRGAVPTTPSEQSTFGCALVAQFCERVRDGVSARQPDHASGRILRGHFAALRDALRATAPFEALTDEGIMEAVLNCEGWSMLSPIPSVEIVEYFIQSPALCPVRALVGPCEACVQAVVSRVRDDCNTAAGDLFGRFPVFDEWVRAEVDAAVGELERGLTDRILYLLESEEAYVFSDDPAFLTQWKAAIEKTVGAGAATYPATLRRMVSSYFGVIVEAVANGVPKMLVRDLRHTLGGLHSRLGGALHGAGSMADLLVERDGAHERRVALTGVVDAADRCLAAIDAATAAPCSGERQG